MVAQRASSLPQNARTRVSIRMQGIKAKAYIPAEKSANAMHARIAIDMSENSIVRRGYHF